MSSSDTWLYPMLRLFRRGGAVTMPLLCLLGALSAGYSQAGAQDGTTRTDERQYTLSGTVVNAQTGEPVRRARVEFHGASAGAQLTDDNGEFRFDGLPSGRVNVSVRKPGFSDERELGIGTGGARAGWALVGPGSGPLNLKLVPLAVVYGRAETVERQPIENLPVRVIARRITEGRAHWQEVESSMTNDGGEFRLANLPPGTYYLEFGPRSAVKYLQLLAGRGEGYPALFYPGVSELSAATPLELSPGQQWNADVSLNPVPLVRVTGTISGLLGEGNAGIEFIDQLGNSVSAATEFDTTKGEFRTVLPPGNYTMMASAWSEELGQRQASVPLNLTSDVAGIRLVLAPVRSLPILVTKESVRPASRRSTPSGGAVPVSVHLTAESGFLERAEYWATPEGNRSPFRLAFGNLLPGKYSVEVTANDRWYVQSARSGGVDLLHEDLILGDDTQLAPIEVSLRDDGASIAGQVRLGKNETEATVLVVPEPASAPHPKSIEVGEDGSFTASPLAPGNYEVLAFDHVDGLEYANPGVLDRYLSKAVHLTLNANERRQVTLDLIKTGD